MVTFVSKLKIKIFTNKTNNAMKIRISLTVTLLLLIFELKAQEFIGLDSQEVITHVTPDYQDGSATELPLEEIGSFTFYGLDEKKLSLPLRESLKNNWGKEIAQYYAAFENVYVYKEQPVDGDPNVITRYRKPKIYKSIKGLESYLRKKTKKENFSQVVAGNQLKKILQVGIAAISEESKWLEEKLKNLKRKEDRIKLFNKITLNNI
jgi:hypothetical protein